MKITTQSWEIKLRDYKHKYYIQKKKKKKKKKEICVNHYKKEWLFENSDLSIMHTLKYYFKDF